MRLVLVGLLLLLSACTGEAADTDTPTNRVLQGRVISLSENGVCVEPPRADDPEGERCFRAGEGVELPPDIAIDRIVRVVFHEEPNQVLVAEEIELIYD